MVGTQMKSSGDERSPVPNTGSLAWVSESDEHGVRSHGPEPTNPQKDAIINGKGRVLIMDDEQTILDVVGDMLGRLGYEAKTALSGDEAIDRYMDAMEGGSPFDAVIMDFIIRGGMGSRETIAELLRLDPDAKIIVSSGYSYKVIMGRHAGCGISEFLPKPYSLKELSDTLAKAIDE